MRDVPTLDGSGRSWPWRIARDRDDGPQTTLFFTDGPRVSEGQCLFRPLLLFTIISIALLAPRGRAQTTASYEGPVGVTGIFNGNSDTGCSFDPLNHNAYRE